jgi:hypothetical protein
MKITYCLIQILFVLLIQSSTIHAQISKRIGTIAPWEIGLSGGVSSFVTSIASEAGPPYTNINYWYRNLNPGIGLSAARNISPALSLEMNWLNTRLSGKWNDSWPPIPISAGRESPLTFNTSINQFDLLLGFNLNQIFLPGDEEDIWHVFFKTGIGMTAIKDHKKFYPDFAQQRLGLSIDAGISYSLNEKFKLHVGSAWRLVDTDILDGVHTAHVEVSGYNRTNSDSVNVNLQINTTEFKKVYELYNYTYFRISYCINNFGSKVKGIHRRNGSPRRER